MTSRRTGHYVTLTLAALSVVIATRPMETAAACRAPNDLEVVVYEDANLKGACQILGIGAYPNTSAFGGRNDKISSLSVGNGVRVALFKDSNYYQPEADFEGGNWYNLGSEVSDQTSSIIIQANNGHTAAIWYEGNWPSDRENFWASEAQGIAHDSWGWYVTHNPDLYVNPNSKSKWPEILGIPFHVNLATDFYPGCCKRALLPRDLLAQGYNHFGDPDFYAGYLFIPMDAPKKFNPMDSNKQGQYPLVAIYRASDLSFVTSEILTHATSDDAGMMHAAWVAIDPSSGILFTSNEHIGVKRGGMHLYQIDLKWLQFVDTALRSGTGYACFRHFNCQIFNYVSEQVLLARDGKTPVNLEFVQGGALSTDGSLIYLSNGYCHFSDATCVLGEGSGEGSNWGVRVFDRYTGVLQARSGNGYGPFNYQMDIGFPNYQEPEGLDYFDTTGTCIPGPKDKCLRDSQLHVLLYSNTSGAIWLKHYSE
jgi:hypothetical protein